MVVVDVAGEAAAGPTNLLGLIPVWAIMRASSGIDGDVEWRAEEGCRNATGTAGGS